MGKTHFRSDVRESGARTASFSTIAGGTITGSGAVTGANVRGTSYFRLGTDVYFISGVPGAFSNSGISAAATSNSGIGAANLGEGTMFLSASKNHPASTLFVLTRQGANASWTNVNTGAAL
jgi:hypothetical protein